MEVGKVGVVVVVCGYVVGGYFYGVDECDNGVNWRVIVIL